MPDYVSIPAFATFCGLIQTEHRQCEEKEKVPSSVIRHSNLKPANLHTEPYLWTRKH